MTAQPTYHMEDFTEDGYRRLLETALKRFRFEPYGTRCVEPHIIMRHDIDLSVHRAACMAAIEGEFGVKTTYCVLLHTPFYNVLEPVIQDKLLSIAQWGHDIGLHFDGAVYGAFKDKSELSQALTQEQTLLANWLQVPVKVFSFHNPEVDNVMHRFQDDIIAGMINTYSQTIRQHYVYNSDSNGYWRHERMFDLVQTTTADRLHLLTHPDWWTPSPMAPRARVERCIQGRSLYVGRYYDELMDANQRVNVGKAQEQPKTQSVLG